MHRATKPRVESGSADQADAAKDCFFAVMSHEMRTSLSGVLGTVELLMRTSLDDEQDGLVGILQRSTAGLLRVIDDLLDVSKADAGALALEQVPFELRTPVVDAADAVRASAVLKGIDLRVRVADGLPVRVSGDPCRLRQVLLNLVSNAVKFTEAGAVEIIVSPDGGRVRFAVIDTGVGIEPGARDRIFDAFAQEDASTTRRFGGTGLGLAICRRIVGLMGGEIEVESEPGVGSCFSFEIELPGADGVVDPAPTSVAHPAVCGRLPRRVLVVDDDEVCRLIAERMLRTLGVEVESVSGGDAAIARVAEGDPRIDLVLMDCSMSGTDGLAATRAIREIDGAGRGLPIVALTAFSTPEDRERCRVAGMDGYLAKPFRLEDLHRALADAVDRQPAAGG